MARRDLPRATDTSWIEVDLGAIERNAKVLAEVTARSGDGAGASSSPDAAGGPARARSRVCAVVKKNAYGLGAVPIAHRLVRAGCDMLAVYSPGEAEQLTAGAITAPILLLGPLRELGRTDRLYRHAVAERLHLSIHDPDQLEAVNRIGRDLGIRVPVHLHLDTGMSRSGLSEAQFHAILDAPADALGHARLAGLYSHPATADDDPDFALAQLQRLEAAIAPQADALPQGVLRHIANSYAALRDPRLHLDMIRPGLGLYGYAGVSMPGRPRLDGADRLTPAARWLSRLNHVGRYEKGAPVGYGSTHTLARPSVLGVAPVGYADGYPLGLSGKGVVRVYAQGPDHPPIDAPVLGRVNMDQIVIDLTDALTPDADDARLAALRGRVVEVYANDPAAPNALHRLAAAAGTHCYELLCRLSLSLPRKYVG